MALFLDESWHITIIARDLVEHSERYHRWIVVIIALGQALAITDDDCATFQIVCKSSASIFGVAGKRNIVEVRQRIIMDSMRPEEVDDSSARPGQSVLGVSIRIP